MPSNVWTNCKNGGLFLYSMEDLVAKPAEQYCSHFVRMLHRISCRRSNPEKMDWLFEEENILPFIPDYLAFHTVGRKRFERRLNRALFQFSDNLWHKLFWPRIRDGLLSYMRTTYFPIFIERTGRTEKKYYDQQVIFTTVEKFLTGQWQEQGQCTFSEMGVLVNEILQECYQQAGYPEDLFFNEKQLQNETALKTTAKYLHHIRAKKDPFDTLVYGSCYANWIDSLDGEVNEHLGKLAVWYEQLLSDSEHISKLKRNNPFFQLNKFKSLLQDKKQILFEVDNCGEVVFDLLLIEHLLDQGHRVVLGAKAKPALNDATIADVEKLLKHQLFSRLAATVKDGRLSLLPIDSVMGGKLLYEASDEYKDGYNMADLLILKGQGNFQTTPMGIRANGKFVPYRYKKPMAFLLPVKSVMSRLCLQSVFSTQPENGTLFLYCYDPRDPATYPK